jgi:uncharacterized metal-binding protein
MGMNEEGSNQKKRVLIMSCSGAANVGQLSNQVASELVREQFANPFCLAGIGAHRRGFVKAASEADTIIIDGCVIGCGRLILEHAEIPVTKYLVLTDLGFEKKMDADFTKEEIERVKNAVRDLWTADTPTFRPASGDGGCSCCS